LNGFICSGQESHAKQLRTKHGYANGDTKHPSFRPNGQYATQETGPS